MYKLMSILFAFCIFEMVHGQILHHQMIGAQGGSYLISNGAKVEQSIGQVVVHGYQADENKVLQGFQQNIWYKLSGTNPEKINIKLYPNPFVNHINFHFSKPLQNNLSMMIFDLVGRQIHRQTIKRGLETVLITLPMLPTAEYIVVLYNSEINQSFKILKQ
jgi:hypothetical protein